MVIFLYISISKLCLLSYNYMESVQGRCHRYAFCILFHPANSRTSDVLKRIVAYFFIVLLLSNLFSLLMPPENVGTRTLIRLLVQDATYILGVVPLLFMNRLPRDFDQRVIKWYTYAICTLIGIGFVHYFFLKAGIPFAPIIRDVGTSNAVAATFLEVIQSFAYMAFVENLRIWLSH